MEARELPKTLHLLDDSELEESNSRRLSRISCGDLPSPSTDVPLQASQNTADNCTLLTRVTEDTLHSENQLCRMQGCVRRKTVLKDGRKPAVSSWQRYWIQIWSSSLAYFSPKSFKGNQRTDFKRHPCKLVSLIDCGVILCENTLHSDMFQIIDHHRSKY